MFSYGDTDSLLISLSLPNGNCKERINKLTKDFEKEVLVYKHNIENIISNVFDDENAIIRINFTNEQTG